MQNARDAHGITGYIGVGGRVQKIDRGGTHKADFWKKRMSEANSAEVSESERKKASAKPSAEGRDAHGKKEKVAPKRKKPKTPLEGLEGGVRRSNWLRNFFSAD